MQVTVKIENSYTDGHESESEVQLDPPEALDDESIDAWFDEAVFQHTGDGHYTDVYDRTGERLGSCYIATVTDAPNLPELQGRTYEWLD